MTAKYCRVFKDRIFFVNTQIILGKKCGFLQ